MKEYTLEHPQLGLIRYHDKKRYWWSLSVLLPLIPALMVLLSVHYKSYWLLLSPLIFIYACVPLLDYLFGSDTSNPPEEIVPQLEQDPYYQRLLYLITPMHYLSLAICAWAAATLPLNLGSFLLFAIVAGVNSGSVINSAHEIGHKTSKKERIFARIALGVIGYGHFCIEHNLGHHRDVATPEDPASSRMGETIYEFMLREVPGTAMRGWQIERQRLNKRKQSFWSTDNHILQSYAITLMFQGSLVLALGWILVPFLLIHNAFAWFQLTSANYIEHYGLLRDKLPNGRYERCKPHHSWNANYIFSNLGLFNLERHSDHHSNPSRRYQSLRSFDDLPELPSGYMGMYVIAYIPWLWFRVMDHRLLAVPHINGDFSKINIHPPKAHLLRSKYAALTNNTATT